MSYHQVTVFNIALADIERAQAWAMDQYDCQGVEEYTLDEVAVDALLGERSYSGGDLPLEVLAEVDSFMRQQNGHYKFFFREEDQSAAVNFLQVVLKHFLCEADLVTLADEDWNTNWKKHYQPIEVAENLIVLPEWEDAAQYSGKTIIKIHPGMGFGTGSHETTFLCLKQLMALKPFQQPHQRVLDYGSGSGILGLTALLLFASWQADMVDIDRVAHHNCAQNMELNLISPARVELLMLDQRPVAGHYPIVFANILQNVLWGERDYLIDQTAIEGHLIISGLLATQLNETEEHYLASSHLQLSAREVLRDWGCLVFRRVR